MWLLGWCGHFCFWWGRKHCGNWRKCYSHQHFLHFLQCFNPLPDMPILGSSNSPANKDMMSKILKNGDIIFWLSRKHCEKRRNWLLRAISSFPTMFSKAVCCWCVKMSKGLKKLLPWGHQILGLCGKRPSELVTVFLQICL